jgi:hypothetical protein
MGAELVEEWERHDRPLSPEEDAVILKLLKKAGETGASDPSQTHR